MSKIKAVVTCDIIKSRQYSNAERMELNRIIKTSFKDCCDLLPQAKADILSFSIVQGDEFQFLINKPKYAYQFVVFYRLVLSQTELKPKIRTGIGIGDISITDSDSYKMDGSAFHRSRDGINLLKSKKYVNLLSTIRTDKKKLDNELEIICQYQDLIESNWSVVNKTSILAKIEYKTLSKASLHKNVSYQAIQKSLKIANWEIFHSGIEYIKKKFSQPQRVEKRNYNLHGL